MAVTLNTTLTDRYANSYVDVAYADDYWANHWSATKSAQWSVLDSTVKARLLIQACRVIETARFTINTRIRDQFVMFYDKRTHTVLQINEQLIPLKYYFYQSLQFPRSMDRDTTTGALYVPEPILLAQCEQAIYSLNFDESAVANRIQGITHDSATIGSIRVRQEYTSDGSMWSPTALEYARPFMLKSSAQVRRA